MVKSFVNTVETKKCEIGKCEFGGWRNVYDFVYTDILNRENGENESDSFEYEADIKDFPQIEDILRDLSDSESPVKGELKVDRIKGDGIKEENGDNGIKEENKTKADSSEFIDKNSSLERKPRGEDSKYKLITRRIDGTKVTHKNLATIEVMSSLVKNVRMEVSGPVRSGAILYTKQKGKTYFCMGSDSSYGDLTDFAGGVRKGETIITGGLRELKEESLGVFGEIKESDVQDSICFYTNNMLIMFIYLPLLDMEKSKELFKLKASEEKKGKIEVSKLVWLEKKEMVECVNGKGLKMYSRVKKILSKVTDLISAL